MKKNGNWCRWKDLTNSFGHKREFSSQFHGAPCNSVLETFSSGIRRKLFENLLGSLKELTGEWEGKSQFSQWRSISLSKAVDYNRRYRHLFIRRVTMSDSTSIVMNNTEVRLVTFKRYNLRLFTYLRDTNLLEIIYIRFADRYFLIYHDDYNKSWCLCIFLLLLQDFIGISWTL